MRAYFQRSTAVAAVVAATLAASYVLIEDDRPAIGSEYQCVTALDQNGNVRMGLNGTAVEVIAGDTPPALPVTSEPGDDPLTIHGSSNVSVGDPVGEAEILVPPFGPRVDLSSITQTRTTC